MNHIIADPKTRKYIYGVVVAVIPLLVIAGVIAEDQVQVWLNFAAAVLGFGAAGLAAPNTPDDKLKPQGYEQGM
ncbi:phage holin [Nesterenkonia rhizosphaerae]|uniref:Holin n=1 Tax=Nesterenkonia rhizosphaerae TaxID=1348272 RepID=A0ABP9G2V6_9MICC